MNGNILIVCQLKTKAIPYTNQVIRILKVDEKSEAHTIFIGEERVADYSALETCQYSFTSLVKFYQDYSFGRKQICIYDMPSEEEVLQWIKIEKKGRWMG